MTCTRTAALLAVLDKFVNSRPGFEYANYGDASSYRADARTAARQKADYRRITGHFLFRNITADMILERARGGRIDIEETWKQHTPDRCPGLPCGDCCDHREFTGFRVSYAAGQYYPTEYRGAAARLVASCLWDYVRDNCMPPARGDGTYEMTRNDRVSALSAGDWLRAFFRREFGRGIAGRYFS